MTNEKDLFTEKLQPNATKLKYANRKILIFEEIGFICLSCIDKNRNPLTTCVDNVLYLPAACSNLMSLGHLSEKSIYFKIIENMIILHCLRKTVAI